MTTDATAPSPQSLSEDSALRGSAPDPRLADAGPVVRFLEADGTFAPSPAAEPYLALVEGLADAQSTWDDLPEAKRPKSAEA